MFRFMVGGPSQSLRLSASAIEKLLGRTPIPLDAQQIGRELSGARILITGAGGSIGSEICRMAARFCPAAICAFDIAETALFYVDREMQAAFPGIDFQSQIGNATDLARLEEVFRQFAPSIVVHAAAYKHVAILERHLVEAVENNVFSTQHLIDLSLRYQAEQFILISTDKAVRPCSVMGMTKRIAEKLVSAQRGTTRFCSVRFGNVLSSNGSVVPTFAEQIRTGGPITVTDPNMKRYFMTVGEAAQLVIQALSLNQGGELFVFDMGEPILIEEIARAMVQLSGLSPDRDIQIAYTGMRPGEKQVEALIGDDEFLSPTSHERIGVYRDRGTAAADVHVDLAALRDACIHRDRRRLLETVMRMVPDYSPSLTLLSHCREASSLDDSTAEAISSSDSQMVVA